MVERRVAIQPRHQRADVLSGIALGLKARPGHLRPVANRQFRDRVDLVAEPGGPAMGNSTNRTLALAPMVTTSRVKTATGSPAAVTWAISIGPRRPGVLGDVDDDAALHQSRVQSQRRIVAVVEQQRRRAAASLARTSASAATVDAAERPSTSDRSGRYDAVDDNDPRPVEIGERVFAHQLGQRRVIDAAGKRRGALHQRAEVGVFPRLDAAMRQAAPLELRESPSRDACATRARAGQRRRRRAVFARAASPRPWCAAFGARRSSSLRRPPRRIRRSPSPPVRAPVPCRRSARSGRPTARARSRARCG